MGSLAAVVPPDQATIYCPILPVEFIMQRKSQTRDSDSGDCMQRGCRDVISMIRVLDRDAFCLHRGLCKAALRARSECQARLPGGCRSKSDTTSSILVIDDTCSSESCRDVIVSLLHKDAGGTPRSHLGLMVHEPTHATTQGLQQSLAASCIGGERSRMNDACCDE